MLKVWIAVENDASSCNLLDGGDDDKGDNSGGGGWGNCGVCDNDDGD